MMYSWWAVKKISRVFILSFALGFSVFTTAFALDYKTPAKQALLVDMDTGAIFFSKNVDDKFPPASLAKLMTAEVVFYYLKTGQLNLYNEYTVSKNAFDKGGARSGGSTMFAELESEISLENLLKALIIQSANDAGITLAEGIAGSEEEFAKLMNERAKEIGLKNSNFENSTGLPAEGQYVTVNDLAKLSEHLIREYPEYYAYYKEPSFEWNKINQNNRNPLFKYDENADGLKTGYTDASGYAIVATTVRDGRRLLTIMSGLESKKQRSQETRRILDYGYKAFKRIDVFKAGEVLGEARVFGGEKKYVQLKTNKAIALYLPTKNKEKLTAKIYYNGPLVPIVKEGQEVGTLKVWMGDQLSYESQLYSAETIKKGDLSRRAVDALKELMWGWL